MRVARIRYFDFVINGTQELLANTSFASEFHIKTGSVHVEIFRAVLYLP
tara:strand:+ start:269 stop:415 length:147 start_codon:yes stop_codon:yes gene_type:complete